MTENNRDSNQISDQTSDVTSRFNSEVDSAPSITPENLVTTSPATYEQLFAHFGALRRCLLACVFGVLIVFLALFPFAQTLYAIMAKPLQQFLPEGSAMIATQVTAPFLVPMKVCLFLAVLITFPWIFYQIWRFIAPGLYQHERRGFIPLCCMSALLFYGGIAMAYYFVLPLAFAFFIQAAPSGVQVMTDMSHYFTFVLRVLLAFGIAFQLPVILHVLLRLGTVTVSQLRQARPYVIVGAFVIGMLLTPPDVVSQILLAVPLWLLYELSLFFHTFSDRKKS